MSARYEIISQAALSLVNGSFSEHFDFFNSSNNHGEPQLSSARQKMSFKILRQDYATNDNIFASSSILQHYSSSCNRCNMYLFPHDFIEHSARPRRKTPSRDTQRLCFTISHIIGLNSYAPFQFVENYKNVVHFSKPTFLICIPPNFIY